MTEEEALESKLADPATKQALDSFTALLSTVKDVMPELSVDGRSARLRAAPDSDTALVLVQLNDTWRISGIEKQTPGVAVPAAPQTPKAKTNPGPGGYVP